MTTIPEAKIVYLRLLTNTAIDLKKADWMDKQLVNKVVSEGDILILHDDKSQVRKFIVTATSPIGSVKLVDSTKLDIKNYQPESKIMAKSSKEGIEYREGDVTINALGKRKLNCPVCNKETTQNVYYVFGKANAGVAAGGILLGAAGAVIASMAQGLKSTKKYVPNGYSFLYECQTCGYARESERENFNNIKKEFGWSNFWGFKGKEKEEKIVKVINQDKNDELED
jgi:hypothetical protein